MGREFRGPSVSHRTIRKIAIQKGTDARGFTESPPMEKGAGGSVAKEVSGGSYKETPIPIGSAPLKNPSQMPGKNFKGG